MPDWPHLWQLTARWAGRPYAGVLLPSAEQGTVAARVFEGILQAWRVLPDHTEFLAWLQREAQQQALAHTAEQRAETGRADLWHDPEWQSGEAVVDLRALRQRDPGGNYTSPEWHKVHEILRRRAMRILPGLRSGPLVLPDSTVEDVFMEALTELVRDRPGKGALLDELVLWEQVPPVFNTIVRRTGLDWLRSEGQRKNQPNSPLLRTSFDDPDAGLADTHADPESARAAIDPWHGVTFDRIHKACADCLSPLQWQIITAIYIEETATRLDLASDPDVLRQLGVAPAASESTRRRAINTQLEAAIAHLATCLQTHDV